MTNAGRGTQYDSSNYHQALFENPKKNSVLLIDSNGIIREVNRAFLLSFGYETGDLIGQHFSILFSETDQQTDMPMREIRTVLDEGQSFDNNYLVNKNRVLTWVSGESVLLTNAKGERSILKVIQNIHTQKESETSITLLNNFNENILSAIEDAVLVLNKDFLVLKANSAAIRLFNLSEVLHLTPDFREMLRSIDNNYKLYDMITGTIRSEFTSSKILLDPAKGFLSQKVFDITCSRLTRGEEGNILLVFRDITIQKDFEQQREDIMNFVAHELSNPLTNITLNIDLMKELTKEELSDDLRGCIERSQSNVLRLKKLIGELYRATKSATGNIMLEKSVFAFDQMVDETIQSIRLLFPTSVITKKGMAPISLTADRDKIIGVLTNYLTNAVKYSGDPAEIEVAIRAEEHSVILSVTDHGQGIAEKDLPFIFSRYYRAEKTKTMEGLGIGLFLSAQIIEAHQGRVWVTSTEGKGSTFYFSLPL
ncbi:MAG TPA: ATP-binding protein [Puia sp.]|jgi:PAS domain S-box-containing protein